MKRIAAFLILNLIAFASWGQGCVTCTNTAGQLGQEKGSALNFGILYLVLIPMVFVASVGIWWYRKNKSQHHPESESL